MDTPPTGSNAAFYAANRVFNHSFSEHSQGVCWAAVIAGAVGCSVISPILLLLGTGIGFSAISPWSDQGVSATTIGISTIVWITVVQLLAALFGGYLAGRLRSSWTALHGHETYFRDTAHGFLSWAVATLVTASILSSAVDAVASGGIKAGAAVAGGAVTMAGAGAAGVAGNAASSSSANDAMSYFTDTMFRSSSAQPGGAQGSNTSANGGNVANSSAEVGRIFTTSLKGGMLTSADAQYLAQLVAQRTGVSTDEAQKRVNDAFTQTQQAIGDAKAQATAAADAARKASAGLALWLVVSMLIGAFAASSAATFGGRRRDAAHVEPITN